MNQQHSNIFMVEKVAKGLSPLKSEVVFVGGAILALYLDDPAMPEIRPTNDVDCVVELVGRSAYHALEKRLRTLGFKHDISDKRLICRWIFEGITVDVMPTDESILGFSNAWYKYGLQFSQQVSLPNGDKIAIMTAPYFMASKIEAFLERGKKDFRVSHDFEDLVTLLDGRANIVTEINTAPIKVQEYLRQYFKKFLKDAYFEEGILSQLPPANRGERKNRILSLLNSLT
jgi:hypothetical protein